MKKNLLLLSCLLIAIQSKSITVSLNYTLHDACNEGIGSLGASAGGGVAPYTFVWSNGYTSMSNDTSWNRNLIAGTYTVTVYDAASDSGTNSFSIINYSSLERGGLVNFIFTAIDPITIGDCVLFFIARDIQRL